MALLLPTLEPFTIHWYAGDDPPLIGDAVNVTLEPAQMLLPALEEIETVGALELFTLMVMAFDVAVADEAQLAFEVMTQVTTAPLVSAEVVNVALFVPTLEPFTFHW